MKTTYSSVGLVRAAIVAASFFITGFAFAGHLDDRLEPSTALVTGKLENGLSYAVEHVGRPENLGVIWLVVNVGSVHEGEKQQGLAHFVEHMAFNGTEDFPKNELIKYFASVGMSFGGDVSAITDFDRTTYWLKVPTDDPAVLEESFRVLENWAHKVSFDAQEVDKERGVILEEWRKKQSPDYRLLQQEFAVNYKETLYAQRAPIGQPDVIQNSSREDLIRFYKDWYQPQNMMVLAVGDFNKAQIESLIKKYFSALPAVESPRTAAYLSIPDHHETLVSIATDPEAQAASITLKIDQKRKPETTLKSKVEQLKNQLFYTLLAQRLVEVQSTADFDADSTGVQLAHGLGLRTNLTIQATANSSQLEQVMKKLLSETYRVAQHGFGTEEFKRVSGHYRNTLQSQANGQSTFQQKHNAMLDQLILEAPYAGEENLATMLLAQLDDITVEDINDVAKEWLYHNDNRSVFLRAPDDQADAIPSKKQVIKAWKKAAAASYEPYTESETIDQLISEIPEPGKVINYFYEKRYDAHLWRLSNGARVILKDRKFAEYGIWMKASSEGGQSKLDDKLYRASPYAGAIIDYMGVGDFSSAQLQRFLLDKNVNLKTSLTETHEVLSGSTTNEDLETFFQLLHLKFTQPRVNAQDYNFIKDQLRAALNSQQMKASWRFLEAVYLASNKHNPRSVNVFSPTALNFNSLDDTVEIYQDRFSDVGDFTFVFVGDIDKASIESLLKTYIASIPGEPFVEKETWQYREDQETKGHLEVHLKEGTENKASVRIELRGQQAWKSYSREVFKAGTSALQILLTEEIRENLSGTYAITVGQSISEFPEGNYTIAISFDCEPERVNELVTAVRRALTKAAEKGFSTEVITSAKQQVVEQRDRDMNRNKIWLDNLADISLHERSYILEDYKYRIAMTNVKVSKVNDAFKVFLRTPDTRYATLLPEGSEVEVEELGALLY